MTAIELINYIYDEEHVPLILESLNCVYITDRGKEFRCGLPNDDSKTRVRINKSKYLNITIFQSDDKIVKGNIITLVMHIKSLSFPNANKWMHEQLGLVYSFKKNTKPIATKKCPLDVFKKVKSKRFGRCNVKDIETFDDHNLQEFTPNLTKEWLSEGILSFTARKFNIGYDYKRKRIIIPERLWCGEDDDYIGVMGRTVVKDYEMLDIPKYLAVIPYSKSVNLYGLQENYKSIQEDGEVVVHESQKSVLKRHSRLDETGVAVGSHDISDEQVKILIGLNVDIIIAFDKGVSLNHIRYTCEKFYKIRPISYVWDNFNLLKDKEAPADVHDKLYKYLLKHKTIYSEDEHNIYIKENQY